MSRTPCSDPHLNCCPIYSQLFRVPSLLRHPCQSQPCSWSPNTVGPNRSRIGFLEILHGVYQPYIYICRYIHNIYTYIYNYTYNIIYTYIHTYHISMSWRANQVTCQKNPKDRNPRHEDPLTLPIWNCRPQHLAFEAAPRRLRVRFELPSAVKRSIKRTWKLHSGCGGHFTPVLILTAFHRWFLGRISPLIHTQTDVHPRFL